MSLQNSDELRLIRWKAYESISGCSLQQHFTYRGNWSEREEGDAIVPSPYFAESEKITDSEIDKWYFFVPHPFQFFNLPPALLIICIKTVGKCPNINKVNWQSFRIYNSIHIYKHLYKSFCEQMLVYMHRTWAIITRGSYVFYPMFQCKRG